ncbi:ester cyclase [Danxiaibacter flavus]|uniref:Ester cyclase n=1 Tax=Danxiaibacter flavus TaxID=3049108 RepID=A0ABV3ZJ87_9BACT|nr:ester cyclase [Chitinophagaceae bacterium DXS]
MRDLKTFYEQYVTAANARDFATIAELINDEVLINGVPGRKEDALGGLKWLTDVVPDYVWHIEDLFVNEDRIAARLRDVGTPAREFFGNLPTGKTIEFMEFASYKVEDNKFVEMWYLIDTAKISEQLKG